MGQKKIQHIWRLCTVRTFDQWKEINQRNRFGEEILSWSGPIISSLQEVLKKGLEVGLYDEDFANDKMLDATNTVCCEIMGQSEIRAWKGLRLPPREEVEKAETPFYENGESGDTSSQ